MVLRAYYSAVCVVMIMCPVRNAKRENISVEYRFYALLLVLTAFGHLCLCVVFWGDEERT